MSGLSHHERMKLLERAVERGDFGPASLNPDGSIIVNFDNRPPRAA